MFVRIWQYEVPPDAVDRFIEAYRASGEWARLFERADGFAGTELFHSTDTDDRFITIDLWRDRSAWTTFLERWQDEYRALDVTLAQLSAVQVPLLEASLPSQPSPGDRSGHARDQSNGR